MPTISNNGIITMHRGDYISIPVDLNIGTGVCPIHYQMKENDVVYFALLEPNQPWEKGLIRRAYTYENWVLNHKQVVIKLNISDTENVIPGTYYYEVKLYIAENEYEDGQETVTTVIPRTKLFILE